MKNIKVLISAPTDQDPQVSVVIKAIESFNKIMHIRGVNFIPVHWQKNLSTGIAESGQEVINQQISDVDMIIAIVGARMGTPTDKAESGTAEELYSFIERTKIQPSTFNTHVFFNTFFDGNVLSLDAKQLNVVQSFQKKVSSLGILYAPFQNDSTLADLTMTALNAFFFESEQTSEISLEEKELEELGLDEYLEESSTGMQNMTKIVGRISKSFTKFGEDTDHLISKENNQTKLVNKGSALVQKLADEINPEVETLQRNLDKVYTNFKRAVDITVEDFINDENISAIKDLTVSIEEMITASNDNDEGIGELEDAIKAIPRRNKKLIKAKKAVLRPVSELRNSIADFSNNMTIVNENLISGYSVK